MGRLFRLVEGQAEGIRQTENLAGGTHFRTQQGVHLLEHVEREDRLLDAEMRDGAAADPQIGQLLAQHDLRRDAGHGDVAHFRNQRDGPGSPGIGLEDVDHIAGDGVLDVHQTDDAEFHRDAPGIVVDRVLVAGGDADRRDDAGGIAGMDSGQLNVFHDGRYVGVLPVGDGIGLALDRVFQEFVDQDRPFRRHADGGGHVPLEHLLVMDDLHPAAPQHIGGADHQRIADPFGDRDGLPKVAGHPGGGHGDAELVHHFFEAIPVLRHIDGLRRCSDDADPGGRKLLGKIQRRLASELHDDPFGLFLFVDGQDILHRQGFEIEPVGRVVVRGNRFRVAVDHDRLISLVPQGESRMDAAVVEFDPLADPVRTAAQDHDLLGISADGDLIRGIVGRVVVRCVLDAADGNGIPALDNPQGGAPSPDVPFVQVEDLGKVAVGESVPLGLFQQIVREGFILALQDRLLKIHQFLHLADKPGLDVRFSVQLSDIRSLAESLIQDELPFARRRRQEVHQLLKGFRVEVLDKTETRPAFFQGADRLLKGLLVVLADAHHLADGAHLGPQFVDGAWELFEVPPGKLHHHVVAPGRVFVQRALPPVGDLVERHPAGQQRRNKGDGETGGLGGQCGGAGGAGIDFNDHHPVRLRIVGKLDVRPADDADRPDNVVRIILEPRLKFRADGEHWGRAVGVTRMDSHGVHVFDEADRDHPVLGVPDDLQLQFLPAQHGFLDKDLPDEAGGDAASRDGPQLLHVVNEAAARSAHRVGRTDHHRIAEGCGDLLRLLDAVGRFAFGHVDAEAVHRCLECDPVLAPLDGIDLNTNHLDSVFVQYPGPV